MIRAAIIILLFPALVSAQDTAAIPGIIDISANPVLEQLLSYHRIRNEEKGTVSGYRVQLLSSTRRKDILDLKRLVYQKMPELPTYPMRLTPYYKLRAGNYLTKMEAYRFLLKIREDYPDAFIVIDQIDVSEL